MVVRFDLGPITKEEGPHRGWTTYTFTYRSRNVRLRTIHGKGDPRSIVSFPAESSIGLMVFSGILTPQGVADIIFELDAAKTKAFNHGYNVAKDEIAAVLNERKGR